MESRYCTGKISDKEAMSIVNHRGQSLLFTWIYLSRERVVDTVIFLTVQQTHRRLEEPTRGAAGVSQETSTSLWQRTDHTSPSNPPPLFHNTNSLQLPAFRHLNFKTRFSNHPLHRRKNLRGCFFTLARSPDSKPNHNNT